MKKRCQNYIHVSSAWTLPTLIPSLLVKIPGLARVILVSVSLGLGVACLSNVFELFNVLMTFIMAIKQLLIAAFNNINTVIKRYKMLT